LSSISNQYLQQSEFVDSVQMFEIWGLAPVFVNNCVVDYSNIEIKSAQNEEEAITML